MDEVLTRLTNHLITAVAHEWDGVILIDGVEGSGKSSLALDVGYNLDNTFNIDRIVFTPEQFEEAIDNSKPEQAIVWDEFITGGMSTEFLTTVQRTLVKRMTMIRKKRLYIIWVMPYFFMVGKYFAVARSRFLLHAYTPDGIKRGVYRAYNYDKKRVMYFRGKREFDYCVKAYATGTFADFFKKGILDKNLYEQKKDEATKQLCAEQEKPKGNIKIDRVRFALSKTLIELKKYGYNNKSLENLISYSPRQVHVLLHIHDKR